MPGIGIYILLRHLRISASCISEGIAILGSSICLLYNNSCDNVSDRRVNKENDRGYAGHTGGSCTGRNRRMVLQYGIGNHGIQRIGYRDTHDSVEYK